jgi:hypothetical protein
VVCGTARRARVGTGFHLAGMLLLPFRRGGFGWSAGCREGAQPVPARDEGVFPGPVRADLEDPLASVADEAGGDVPDPVAERVRLGVPESFLVVEAEEAGPGGEVGGDVRGQDPALVDLPGLRRYL